MQHKQYREAQELKHRSTRKRIVIMRSCQAMSAHICCAAAPVQSDKSEDYDHEKLSPDVNLQLLCCSLGAEGKTRGDCRFEWFLMPWLLFYVVVPISPA